MYDTKKATILNIAGNKGLGLQTLSFPSLQILLSSRYLWENVRRPLEIDIEAPVPGGWN